MIYFDYNATTPLDSKVREAMLPFLGGDLGQPFEPAPDRTPRALSPGRSPRRSRDRAWLQAKRNGLYSGGTESANLAVMGTARHLKNRGLHIITSSIEHHAVLHACQYLAKKEGFEITYLPVDSQGLVSPESLRLSIRRTPFWSPLWRPTMKSAQFSR